MLRVVDIPGPDAMALLLSQISGAGHSVHAGSGGFVSQMLAMPEDVKARVARICKELGLE